jgi:hypothetical protein
LPRKAEQEGRKKNRKPEKPLGQKTNGHSGVYIFPTWEQDRLFAHRISIPFHRWSCKYLKLLSSFLTVNGRKVPVVAIESRRQPLGSHAAHMGEHNSDLLPYNTLDLLSLGGGPLQCAKNIQV